MSSKNGTASLVQMAQRHSQRVWSLFNRRTAPNRGAYELVDSMANQGIEQSATQHFDLATSDHNSFVLPGDPPTYEEKHSLRKIADNLPWSAFLIAVVEVCERFTYNGLSGDYAHHKPLVELMCVRRLPELYTEHCK